MGRPQERGELPDVPGHPLGRERLQLPGHGAQAKLRPTAQEPVHARLDRGGLKRHACELFELGEQELLEFWQDVARVAKALDTVYQPTKINYCIFGHLCPHIHCHLLVHSFADDPEQAD
jgi:diadenosine tetraphosphate (Ap4A) HIT family hydrolase